MSSGNNQNDDFEQYDGADFESLDDFSATEAEPVGEPEQAEAAKTAAEPVPEPAAAAKDQSDEAKQGVLAAITDLSPYTVMLAISLIAVLICIFILWSELAAYNYDRKASDARIVSRPAAQVAWYEELA